MHEIGDFGVGFTAALNGVKGVEEGEAFVEGASEGVEGGG